jgi:hypothetical protein
MGFFTLGVGGWPTPYPLIPGLPHASRFSRGGLECIALSTDACEAGRAEEKNFLLFVLKSEQNGCGSGVRGDSSGSAVLDLVGVAGGTPALRPRTLAALFD